MKLAAERHRRILERLERETSVSVAVFAEEHQVTPMTIWRDLKLLMEQGLLKRVRGGALRAEVLSEEAFNSKLEQSSQVKEQLASYAAREFISQGQVLAFEGGTTVAAIAPHLNQPGLTVLTNSYRILQRVQGLACRPGIYGSGGLLREESGTFVGREALAFFNRRKTDVFFMSATGFDAKFGLTDPNPQEIEVKQVMAAKSRKVVLIADSSKAGVVSLMEVVPWRRVDAFVTDQPVGDALEKVLKLSGTRLHLAGIPER
jgi:DeoR family fructose operon transcriptional repressor